MINFVLKRCVGQERCLSEKEMIQWFRAKYIFLRLNRIRFDANERGPPSIIKESFGQWVPIVSSFRVEVPFLVTRTELNLQDDHISMDGLTELTDDSLFDV
mmetsp:Transcript_32060/g.39771  ORF Transcript_32060/g.39771 Transcript_32060/m.39771 type:complete len:101 (+) Transcript_32060:601-903(+)